MGIRNLSQFTYLFKACSMYYHIFLVMYDFRLIIYTYIDFKKYQNVS